MLNGMQHPSNQAAGKLDVVGQARGGAAGEPETAAAHGLSGNKRGTDERRARVWRQRVASRKRQWRNRQSFDLPQTEGEYLRVVVNWAPVQLVEQEL